MRNEGSTPVVTGSVFETAADMDERHLLIAAAVLLAAMLLAWWLTFGVP